jgi:PAS domain S-box-containing protein
MPGVNRLLNFSRHKAIALSCGLAVIAISATVLAGWLTGSRALTAVMPGLIPMAPNTAIAFALLGTALCVLGGGRSWSRAVVRACVLLTLAMIVPRMVEYVLGTDFNVDSWVIEVPHEELSGTPVGRMAFFTALCFLFASIVFFALSLPARHRTVEALAGVASVTLTSIAVIFFFGYLIGSPLFSVGPTIPMALNTSFSFLLLGAGLISSMFDKRLLSFLPAELDAKMLRMHRMITAGFGLAFSTVLVVTILAYENSVRFAENSELVSHSYQLLAESGGLVATLKDAETGARGFVLSGNPDFLEPYEVARGRIGEQLLALKHLEKHHPHQQKRIDELAPFIEMRIRSATELMDVFGLNGPTAAQKLVASEEWKTAMDSIETFVSDLQEEERIFLELRLLQHESGLSRSITFFSLLTILVIILFTALYLVIERGLTERQRSEVALREAAREIEDLYHNAPCGYHSLDASGTFVQINATELSWLGWSREEVVGKMRFLDFLSVAGTELFKQSFPKFLENGSIKDLEFEMKRRDGSTFWVLLSATALIDDRGNFVRSRSTMFDITDKRRALEELHLQTNLYDTLLKTQSNLGEGVIMTETDRIIFVNEAFCRITGYPEVEIMALGSIFELIPAQRRDAAREQVTDFLRGETVDTRREMLIVHKTGRLVDLEIASEVIRAGGPPRLIAIVRDITARKNAERATRTLNASLKRKGEELELANKELETFSYTVSHDLRSPLRHIGGFVELLQKHAGHTIDEKGNRYLGIITTAAKHMGDLIDDLLVFSRMGRADLMNTRVDLTSLAQDVIQGLEPDTQGRKIQWKLGSLPEVLGDPSMLRMVFVNLISNALKYTRPRPVAVIELDSRKEENGDWVVWVKDNGVGFDMNYVHKLFGVFQRLHSSDEFEGTGIGLATVQRIMLRHGGRVWVEGKLGEGAIVYCAFPHPEEKIP